MNLNFKNAVPYSENLDKGYYVKDEIFKQSYYGLDEPILVTTNDNKKSGQCCVEGCEEEYVEECDTVMKQLRRIIKKAHAL